MRLRSAAGAEQKFREIITKYRKVDTFLGIALAGRLTELMVIISHGGMEKSGKFLTPVSEKLVQVMEYINQNYH